MNQAEKTAALQFASCRLFRPRHFLRFFAASLHNVGRQILVRYVLFIAHKHDRTIHMHAHKHMHPMRAQTQAPAAHTYIQYAHVHTYNMHTCIRTQTHVHDAT